jgi:hypothetical protein
LPPLPLGRDGIREVQNQLIALGFDPGAADGQAGPVTVATAQQVAVAFRGTKRRPIPSSALIQEATDVAEPRNGQRRVPTRSVTTAGR